MVRNDVPQVAMYQIITLFVGNKTLFYVNIYGSYKLLKNSPFFGPTCMYDAVACNTGVFYRVFLVLPCTSYKSVYISLTLDHSTPVSVSTSVGYINC